MDYSPKLKNAMDEIRAILKRHDIAGAITLMDRPSFAEHFMEISPSWSCASVVHQGSRVGVLFKASLQQYGGDQNALNASINDSLAMIHLLQAVTTTMSQQLGDLDNRLAQEMRIVHGPITHSSHNQQNN